MQKTQYCCTLLEFSRRLPVSSVSHQSFNKSAATIFGYEAAEIVGQNVSKLIPWKIAKRHDKFMKRYMEGGRKSKIIGSSRELKALHKVCCIL
jgi:PAS domain S-box-containing protein